MQAHGSDRIRRGNGEQWILLSPHPKGWLPRTPKTMTAGERPGSAVLVDERYFEVVAATPSGSGVRYVLEPWREENVMRTVDTYDEASEARREEERRAAIKRTAGRHTTNLLGVFAGHLPAAVQERLASELGVLATRITTISLILPVAVIAVIVNEWVRRKMGNGVPLPAGWMFVAGYLAIETKVRLNIVWTQSRPVGSAAGFIVYAIYWALHPNRKALPPLVDPPARHPQSAPPPDVAAHDAFMLREPLLTLLSPAEQARAAAQYGYDYRRMASLVAAVILLFCVIGAVSSWLTLQRAGGLSPLLSLLAAGGLALEQIVRLAALRRGPVASVLAPLVRPFVGRLISTAPRNGGVQE